MARRPRSTEPVALIAPDPKPFSDTPDAPESSMTFTKVDSSSAHSWLRLARLSNAHDAPLCPLQNDSNRWAKSAPIGTGEVYASSQLSPLPARKASSSDREISEKDVEV